MGDKFDFIHLLLEVIVMHRSNKTRLLLRDKYKMVYSDRHYSLENTALNMISRTHQIIIRKTFEIEF